MPASLRTVPLAVLLLGLVLPQAHAEDVRASVQPNGADMAAALAVSTDRVRAEEVSLAVSGTGLVEAWQEVAVGAETGGVALQEVLVSEGDHVQAGQVLARLDAALLRAQIAQQDAAVKSAEASARNAEAALERAQRLSKSGTLASETLEERETAAEIADAAVQQGQALRRTLGVQLDRLEVRAPFAGIVSARPAVAGGLVQAGAEVARIQRDGVLEARISVPEQRLSLLELGDTATVEGPDGASVQATVTALSQTVDPSTHLGTVSVRLPRDSTLRAGMFVRGTIMADSETKMTVAQGALTWSGATPAVFVVNADSTVSRRTVEAGSRSGDRIAVSGDLKPGETVVAQGAGFLDDGNRVLVVENQAMAGEQAQ